MQRSVEQEDECWMRSKDVETLIGTLIVTVSVLIAK